LSNFELFLPAPDLIIPELANVFRKKATRGDLTPP
jgi:hypothetical protein